MSARIITHRVIPSTHAGPPAQKPLRMKDWRAEHHCEKPSRVDPVILALVAYMLLATAFAGAASMGWIDLGRWW